MKDRNNGEYETGYEPQVINSHVIKCHVCEKEQQAVVLIWSDGDVDFLCMQCRHKERNSVD